MTAVRLPQLGYFRSKFVPPFPERDADGVDRSDQNDYKQAGQQAKFNEILAALITAKQTDVTDHELSKG
jgi:hypothetical protein